MQRRWFQAAVIYYVAGMCSAIVGLAFPLADGAKMTIPIHESFPYDVGAATLAWGPVFLVYRQRTSEVTRLDSCVPFMKVAQIRDGGRVTALQGQRPWPNLQPRSSRSRLRSAPSKSRSSP